MPSLIDVHHHVVPSFYLKENLERIPSLSGIRTWPDWASWTPQRSLKAMDEHGVAIAVLSLSMPGVWFGEAKPAICMARRCNEYMAELVGTYQGRFGFFATVALPDAEGAMEEIGYALDVLKANGIGLLTSHENKWLGHPDHWPVLGELNRRKAVVFVHPTIPAAFRNVMPGIRDPMVEAPQDTTRAVISLLFSGALERFPDIKFILPHAGGFVPMAVGRFQQYASPQALENVPRGITHYLKRLYYDIAGTAYPPAIAALTSLAPTSQILFGSDFPYIGLEDTARRLPRLSFEASQLLSIERENVLRLLPALDC